MRFLRLSGLVAGTAAIALASLVVASPAAGATLPDGQKITIIAQDFPIEGPIANTYYDVSPADATGTQVGSPSGALVTALDVNDDGVGYGVGTVPPGNNQIGSIPMLYPTNAATGVTGSGVVIDPVDPDVTITQCDEIDVQPDGTISVACINQPDNLVATYLGTVTPDGAFTVHWNDNNNLRFTGLAVDPSGQMWAFSFDEFWPVDRSASTWTLGSVDFTDGQSVTGADFASDGQLFITSPNLGPSLLSTLDLATGDVTLVNAMTAGGDPLFASAITVWGKKALPATGPAELFPVGLGTALLLLAGAALIATSRIQRRAA